MGNEKHCQSLLIAIASARNRRLVWKAIGKIVACKFLGYWFVKQDEMELRTRYMSKIEANPNQGCPCTPTNRKICHSTPTHLEVCIYTLDISLKNAMLHRPGLKADWTLRNSNLSSLSPRLNSRHSQNCFKYRGSSVCNSLPSEIKHSRTFGSFQRKLKAMLVEKNY